MKSKHTLTPEMLTLFETLPDLYLILSPSLIILTASHAYLEATLTESEKIIGKYIFEVFPDNPNAPQAKGVSNLGASFRQVLSSRKPHQMAIQHYDVPHPTEKGIFVERYWAPLNTPVHDEEGEVSYIIHKVVNVTELVAAQQKVEQGERRLQGLTEQLLALNSELVKARAQAELERRKLHNILMQAPAMICIFEEPSHIFKLVNPPYQRLVSERPLVGKPIREAMPELQGQPIFELLDRVYRTGESFYAYEMKVQLDHDNLGQLGENYYNFIYQALRNLDGDIEGILVFAYQVTAQVQTRQQVENSEKALQMANAELVAANEEINAFNEELRASSEEVQAANDELLITQKQLQQLNAELETRVAHRTRDLQVALHEIEEQREQLLTQHKRLHTLFMEAPAPIVILEGPALIYQLVNPAYQQIFPGRELLGKPLLEAIPEVKATSIVDILKGVYQTGESFVAREMPLMLARHEGGPLEEIYWTFTYQARRNGHGIVDGIMVFAYEVTHQVKARRVVMDSEKQAQAVAEELAAANEELAQSNRQLLRTNIDLDNFIYTASHDLKAPISNIEGLMHTLLRTLPAESLNSERVRRITTLMGESVERFKRTITSLTEVVKLQKDNNGEAISMDLSKVIREVRLDLAPQLEESKAHLEIDVAACPSVYFSEKNLRSVIYNLLSNAIKYRSPDRVPVVSIHCTNTREYSVLTITDNGLGIETERISQLFTMFKRFHDHVEGSGIGLYMVKKMVENAQGKIEVESRVGIGSTFRVYFPHHVA